ncbi:hypothetical protein HBI25_148960 [Parastagonospora nodorum]|nr:hypothetical protein HBH53_147660 [Parastagonospora nodorum]KAH3967087.1 hypothetical protein HBH51_139060 [Parastagonospora nodorum]KAH5556074.1 hypothetical protein HBI25_148960 [Parastagonospora nodorum]KAH6037110.1 hypothetical protein HBI54_178850 [Parastagonospora nodorum]
MGKPTPHGQQPARRTASRLRNQVDRESADEERASDSGIVQVPNSQFFVPETQLGEPRNNDPLSPRSTALLERTSVRRSAEAMDSHALVFKPLAKESYADGPPVRFTFGQPKKVTSKTPPEVEVPSKQQLIELPATAQSSNGGNDFLDSHTTSNNSPKDHAPITSPPHLPATVTADAVPQDLPNAEEHVVEDVHAPSSHTSVGACKVQVGGGEQNSLHDIFSDLPSSVWPNNGDIRVPKKPSKPKKGKKGKKIANKKPHGVPWPPRSYLAALRASQAPCPDDTVEHQPTSENMASPSVEQDITHHSRTVNNDSGTADTYQDDHGQVAGGVPRPLEHLEVQGSQFHPLHTERFPVLHPATDMTGNLLEETTQQAAEAFNHQDDQQILLQESQLIGDPHELVPNVSFVAPVPHSRLHVTTVPQPRLQNAAFGQHALTGDCSENNIGFKSTVHPKHPIAYPKSHLPQPMKTGTRKQHMYQPDDSILYTVINHNQPHRVEKVQKKRGVPSGPQHVTSSTLVRSHDLDVQDDFDKTLDGLREAHHADRDRKDHDMATQKAHFEEIKTLLKDEIQRSSDTIDEWKVKCAALEESTKQLRGKASRNQKFVTGLQTDHEKSQKSALAFQDECKQVLQQKITEMEHEKVSLQHDFEATVDTLAKGHRTLKATIDELYVRFIISESKRKDLAENLAKQSSMYEEERTRRKDLEAKLLPSFQSVQRELGDRSTQIVQKLETLQSSMDGVTSGLCENSGVQECLDALQKFQDTSFLTVKDVNKAEGMLRFVHSSLCSKFDTLVSFIEHKKYPTEDIKTFISGQLQHLRSEVLRFDEVAAESRKAQEAKLGLAGELEAERQQTQNLNEQLENARRAEGELDIRRVQLERQLADVDVAAHGDNAKPSNLVQVAQDLREKTKELEEECRIAKAEVERLQCNIKKRDRKLVDYDASVSLLKEQNTNLSEQLKAKAKPPDVSQLRHEVEKDLQQGFIDKESGYRNDVHRLTSERDGLQALVDQHDKRIDAVKARCEEAKKDVSSARSELELAQNQKTEIEARCKALQRTAQDHSFGASEVSKLKEQMRQKSEELQSKTEAVVELESALSESESLRTALKEACEHQQTEISQHLCAIESLRQETDIQLQEDRKRSEAAIQLAQNKNSALQKEKDDLQAKLESRELNEAKLSDSHKGPVLEREDLRHRTAELESAQEISSTQILHLQEELRSKTRKHEETLGTLRQHQENSDSALKEAEAKIQLQKTEHTKKIEFDRRKYEAIVQNLQEELSKAKKEVVSGHASQQQTSSSSLPPQDPFAQEIQIFNSGKAKKKVNRGNTLVLTGLGASSASLELSTQHSTRDHRRSAGGHSDTLFDEELHNDDSGQLYNDQGLSVVDPAAEQVEDTQELWQNLLPTEERIEKGTSGSLRGSKHSNRPSTELSSLSDSLGSEDLAILREESQGPRRPSTPVFPDPRHISQSQRSSEERILETPTRSDRLSASSFHSSQCNDRPRSQANTASRLMPPPGSKSSRFDQRKPTHVPLNKGAVSHQTYTGSRRDNQIRNVHQPPSSLKQSQNTSGQLSSDRQDHTFTVSNRSHGHKRQSAFGEGGSSKKQRSLSQSFADNPSSGSRSIRSYPYGTNPSRTSTTTAAVPSASLSTNSHSRDQRSSSIVGRAPPSRVTPSSGRARKQPSSASRSSAVDPAHNHYGGHQTRSKTQVSERFDQELRGA